MAAAAHGIERDGDSRPRERVEEQLALVPGHERIHVPVNDQEWGSFLRHAGDWVGAGRLLFVLLNAAANEQRFRGIGCVVHLPGGDAVRVHLKEIGGSEEVRNRLHATGDVEVLAYVELLVRAGRSEHGHQVSARRGAVRTESLRIVAVLLRVRAQPADGRFAVFDLRWPQGIAAQAVVDRGHGVPLPEERCGPHVFLAASTKRAAVNQDDEWRICRVRGHEKVQFLALMPVAHIGQVVIEGGIAGNGNPVECLLDSRHSCERDGCRQRE